MAKRGGLLPALICVLIGVCVPVDRAASAPPTDLADASQASAPTPEQKSYVAARLYWAITTYFAHREALPPGYDFERRFRQFLNESVSAATQREFDLACMRLLASLRNGHTWFSDPALAQSESELPFRLRLIDGQWIVTRSQMPSGVNGLDPGDAVIAVDGHPIGTWMATLMGSVNGSNDTERASLAQARAFLWPMRFRLELSDGRNVAISRDRKPAGPWRGLKQPGKVVTVSRPRPDVVMIAIPGFEPQALEDAALDAVKQNRSAGTLLFDVRGNGGASTPTRLLAALIDRPYRDMLDETPLHAGTLDAWAALGQPTLTNTTLRSGGDLIQPDHPIYAGRVLVLVDRNCASACEDSLLALRGSHRATLVGETSWGSTGQPFLLDFPELGMRAAIGAKRKYFPDGSAFEGVAIPVTVSSLRSGRDEVLERALELAGKPPARP